MEERKVHARTELYYGWGSSDKVYNASLVEVEKGKFLVDISYGRRGSHLNEYSKPDTPTSYPAARTIYKNLIASKLRKDYEITHQHDVHEKLVS